MLKNHFLIVSSNPWFSKKKYLGKIPLKYLISRITMTKISKFENIFFSSNFFWSSKTIFEFRKFEFFRKFGSSHPWFRKIIETKKFPPKIMEISRMTMAKIEEFYQVPIFQLVRKIFSKFEKIRRISKISIFISKIFT